MAILSLNCLNAQELRMPKYGFLDNWSISAGIGANMTFADNYELIKPQNWGPEAWVSLNKDWSPVLGTRVLLGWDKSSMLTFTPNENTLAFFDQSSKSAKEFLQDMRQMPNSLNASLDFTFNVLNLFSYNYDRNFNVLAIVGVGYSHLFDKSNDFAEGTMYKGASPYSKGNYIVPKVGLQVNYKVSEPVSIFLEGNFKAYSDKLDQLVNTAQYDGKVSLTAGITYRFKNQDGSRGFRYIPSYNQEDVDALNKEINNLRAELEKKPTEIIVHDTLVIKDERVVNTSTPMTIRFSADSYKIEDNQKANLENLAEFLKDNPEMVVSVVGYADKNTGTTEYNQSLSEKRAKAVKDILVDEYGIDSKQLNVSAEGDKVQQYKTNNWNRAVLIIQ